LKRVSLDAVDSHVARVEAATGVQVVVALIDKADTYLELPWRAFALGASLGALVAVVIDAASHWWTAYVALATAAATLGTGAALAVVALLVPAFARLFLRDIRRDAEVRLYAQSLFLRRELFATRERNAVLVLVARFERKVEIVADKGFDGRVGRDEWSRVIDSMTPPLADSRYADAFRNGLEAIETLLVAKGYAPRAGGANELPDRPIVERGARG
jgi:putative membrane protein